MRSGTATPRVQVLLATHNGAAFLTEQLDSVLAQTWAQLEVLAADDGSSDTTVDLLRRYQRAHPDRVRVVGTDPVGGAARNFFRLLRAADADYVLFCDQDDVWSRDKVDRQVVAAMQLERARPGAPILVHTDLQVVDPSLRVVQPSFSRSQRLNVSRPSLGKLLLQNTVTGCTALINQPMTALIRGDGDRTMIMHDWWCAVAAACFGSIAYLDVATVMYRQHGGNTVGATHAGARYFLRRAWKLAGGQRSPRPLERCATQAQAFLAAHGDRCKTADRAVLELVAALPRADAWTRRRQLLAHGLLSGSWPRIAGLLLRA